MSVLINASITCPRRLALPPRRTLLHSWKQVGLREGRWVVRAIYGRQRWRAEGPSEARTNRAYRANLTAAVIGRGH